MEESTPVSHLETTIVWFFLLVSVFLPWSESNAVHINKEKTWELRVCDYSIFSTYAACSFNASVSLWNAKNFIARARQEQINVCGHSIPFLCFAKTSALRWKRENFSLFLRGKRENGKCSFKTPKNGTFLSVSAVPFRSDTCPAAPPTDRRRREKSKGKLRGWNHRVPKLDTYWEACMVGKWINIVSKRRDQRS